MSTGLYHLFFALFLYNFACFMGVPVAIDVMMAALCPGQDECSFAIYLAGLQQSIIGMGSIISIPLIGSLSDYYGRKVLITIPMFLNIFPTVIIAYSRERAFYLTSCVLGTLINMLGGGAIFCIAHAYVADIVAEQGRSSAFGILGGLQSCAYVFGCLLTRFLPSVASVFQVSAGVAIISLVYLRIFVPESNMDASVIGGSSKEDATTSESLIEKGNTNTRRPLRRPTPSFCESISLLKSSRTFLQATVVSFFIQLGQLGIETSSMFYLKSKFQFDKDQFSELNIISGVTGTTAQMFLMPIFTRVVSDEKLLAIGLAFNCVYMFLYALAWSSWVPYLATTLQIVSVIAGPCLRSIVSKQVGPTEQGKAQGCIEGLNSFASIIAPWMFSPLTALFLSDHAPFEFPGFSIMCAGFLVTIAFIQSILMKAPPPTPLPNPDSKVDEYDSVET